MNANTLSFESVVNNPVHQAEATARYERKAIFSAGFRQGLIAHRKQRIQIEAARYSILAGVAAVLCLYTALANVPVLAVLFGVSAAVTGGIACYGWGRHKELSR